MEIPVLLEPTANGFRATTGGPLHLTAEGETEAETLGRVNRLLADRMRAGKGKLVGVATNDSTELEALVGRFANDPFMAEWADATAEVRRERDAEEGRQEAD